MTTPIRSNSEPEPFEQALPLLFEPDVPWAEAGSLLTMASAAGHDYATYALATWYLFGRPELGIRKNRVKAVSLLKRASRSCGLAMSELAVCYETGRGTEKDLRVAFLLYRKATRFGVIKAWFDLQRCYYWGIGTPRDRRKADAALRKAEALGARLNEEGNIAFSVLETTLEQR
jgi:TPR repeat protein